MYHTGNKSIQPFFSLFQTLEETPQENVCSTGPLFGQCLSWGIMNSTPATEPEFLLYSNLNTNQTMDSSSCDVKCIFYVVTNMIIFILGVAGNGLVIWIAGFKVKKSVITIWYLSLAVSDFIFCSTLLFNVVYMDWDSSLPLNDLLCLMIVLCRGW
ncbi:hypothetical protein NFI96_008715 [Prochilodus magdalenae]|nr:hypothetical protein NFI96_008715 [Prochilodus magdalenae]